MKLLVRAGTVFVWLVALSLPAADRLILVTLDGARTQEMFQGMNREVWQAQNEGKNIEETELYRKFWADTPEERRRKLLPFFWDRLMKDHGAIVGNRFKGSEMKLTNRHRFSYPGYSEILTGAANDERIDSNSKVQNPRVTVLEFLQRKLALPPEKVAAFACWDVMNWIVKSDKDAFVSNAGFEAYEHSDPAIQQLSRLQFETPTPWDSVRHDTYTFAFALAHMRAHRPPVLYLSLGETDDWAHDKRYDRVLEALHRSDRYFRQLWEWLESQDDYRGRTTVIFGTDHGRGDNEFNWMHHNDKLEGAKFVWLAAAGAGVKARGELTNTEVFGQNQIAATMCRALDVDYREYKADIGKPIELFFTP